MRPSHIIVLVIVILIVFGASKLPDIARSIGQSAKVLKKEMRDLSDDDGSQTPHVPSAPPVQSPNFPGSDGQHPQQGAAGGYQQQPQYQYPPPGQQNWQQPPPQQNQQDPQAGWQNPDHDGQGGQQSHPSN